MLCVDEAGKVSNCQKWTLVAMFGIYGKCRIISAAFGRCRRNATGNTPLPPEGFPVAPPKLSPRTTQPNTAGYRRYSIPIFWPIFNFTAAGNKKQRKIQLVIRKKIR